MVIDGYSIGGYWCLLMVIILVVIDSYCIGGYCWLLIDISDYFYKYYINGYW
jgi:hypothetical protein